MSREAVVLKTSKKKIDNIKKKYKNMQMSDDTAAKIVRLNNINSILKAATAAVGIVTVVDFFIPDPVLGLDEAALTALTGVLGSASSVVSNKIENIANSEDATLQMDEITTLTGQLTNAVGKVKQSRSK